MSNVYHEQIGLYLLNSGDYAYITHRSLNVNDFKPLKGVRENASRWYEDSWADDGGHEQPQWSLKQPCNFISRKAVELGCQESGTFFEEKKELFSTTHLLVLLLLIVLGAIIWT